MKTYRWMFAIMASVLMPLAGAGQDVSVGKDSRKESKQAILSDAEKWSSRLTTEELLSLPNRNTDEFKAAIVKIAELTDGPREHVNEYLTSAGYPVDAQNDSWNDLAPATKVALAAKQAFVHSERNGQLFGALLAKRLAAEHPSVKKSSELKSYLALETAAGAKPEFAIQAPAEKLPALPDEISRGILTLASFVSSGGAVTEADLAAMTPLKPSEQVEILASAKSSVAALETLIARTHERFKTQYTAENAELLTKRVFGKWTRSVYDSYPITKKYPILMAWVDVSKANPENPNGGPDKPVGGPEKPKGDSGALGTGGAPFNPKPKGPSTPETLKPGGATGKPAVGVN